MGRGLDSRVPAIVEPHYGSPVAEVVGRADLHGDGLLQDVSLLAQGEALADHRVGNHGLRAKPSEAPRHDLGLESPSWPNP